MNFTARHGYRQHHMLLQRELGEWAAGLELTLTPVHQRIVHTLDWLDMQSLLGYAGPRVGAPERTRAQPRRPGAGLCCQGRPGL